MTHVIILAPNAGPPGPKGDLTPEAELIAEEIRLKAAEAEVSAASSKADAELAEVAKDGAEEALALAVSLTGLFGDTAEGLLATNPGQVFGVPVANNPAAVILYANVSGTAVDTGARLPSTSLIEAIGISDQDTSLTGLSFFMYDAKRRISWLATDMSGGPTPYGLKRIGAGLNADNTPALSDAGLSALPDVNNRSFAIVDSTGRFSDIELGFDGHVTERVIALWSKRLKIAGLGPSGPNISCPGDSLTFGSGGDGTSYPSVLQSLMPDRIVRNLGVGGETSRTIAGRQGSRPWLAMPEGGAIPSSGSVVVTLTGDDGPVAPLEQGSAGVNPVRIAGVEGVLTKASGVYSFSRSASGSAVPVNFNVPVITEASRATQSDIQIMWWGQNDNTNDATDIIGRQKAAITWMLGTDKRWLVIGLTTSTAVYRAPMEAQFLRAFGRRFINMREYLSSAAAMQDAGLTPTQADLDLMAAGSVPWSLRVDSTHLNAAGYILVANYIYKRILEMGWI